MKTKIVNPKNSWCLTLLTLILLTNSLVAQVPTITNFTPQTGKPGDVVTITGANFNTTAANNIVFFGATSATVTAATATSLTVTVPAGATYSYITVLNTTTSLVAFSAKQFTPTYSPAKTGITATDFLPKQDFTTGTVPQSVAIGDLDGDGKADLAVANISSNTVSVFRNTATSGSIATGSFAAKVDFTTGSAPQSVSIGDLDGDGKADLAVANSSSSSVSVFHNTTTSGSIGSGSFAAKVDFTTGNSPYSVAIGDLDGDGKPDLAVANVTSSTVSVFRNTATSGSIGSSSFAAKVDFTTGTSPYSVAIGDLDGDGKADLAVANRFRRGAIGTVSVIRNTATSGSIGTGSFAAKVDFTARNSPQSVAIGDLDGDGKADLAVTNNGFTSVSVFHNTATSGSIGSSSFAAKVDFTTGANSVAVAIGDLDGDGKADLAVTNGSASVSVLRNADILIPIPATHLSFDGGDDVVSLGSGMTTFFAGKTQVTLEAWVKPETNSGFGVITGNYDYPTTSMGLQMLLRRDNAGYLFAIDGGSGTISLYATNTVVLNTWQHIAGTWDGSTMRIYVNGVLINSVATTGTIPAKTTIFSIGGNAHPEKFRGSIDEVRIWETARTIEQINGSKNCELQGTESGLVAYYKFNQGINGASNAGITNLPDATSNANNGTLSSFALNGTISNWLAGSPVTTPVAPSVSSQILCENTTVANLVPAPGAAVNWYNSSSSSTPLNSTDAITASGTYYVAAVNANGCESSRVPVTITISTSALASGNQNSTLNVSGQTNFPNCASLIATVNPNGASPISGNTTASVWIETTQATQFVKRHYEITPANNAATATGRVTLYFTQAEFNDFNAVNTVDLPTGPADASGIANLLIEKRGGTSSDGSGLPTTYSGSITTINPADADITWDAAKSRWEVTFDVTGFSGFFVKTIGSTLPVTWLNINGGLTNNKQAVISWKVNENNVADYAVEKSTDGRNFTAIAAQNSKGNGENNYQLTELASLQGVAYYRIKQTDNDGRFSYSAIIKLNADKQLVVSVYPNPFTNSININSSKIQTAVITDATGKTVKQLQLNAGFTQINTQNWASGIYILKVNDGETIKIIKE